MWDSNRRFFSFNIRKNSRAGVSSSSGILPPSIVQESRVPQFYRDTIAQCGAENINKLPNQNDVICLLWRSGLPEAVLNAIWNSIGVSPNGQPSRQEFYSILVLIALAQKNMTISDLSTLPSLPIPHLSTVQPKSMTIKQFKKDATLANKPNGHLFKNVHPLFTEPNVKLKDDLISFESFDKTESTEDQNNEDLYSLSSSKPPTLSKISNKDKLIPVWERIIDVTLELFAPIKQTNAKMLDAFYTEKGHNYLKSLISIQQIIKRVCQSCRQCPNADPSLVSKCEILAVIWENLLELIDTQKIPLEEPLEMEKTEYICNICGTYLNVNNTYFDADTELSYHINCANFWLNRIDKNLPQ